MIGTRTRSHTHMLSAYRRFCLNGVEEVVDQRGKKCISGWDDARWMSNVIGSSADHKPLFTRPLDSLWVGYSRVLLRANKTTKSAK